jgi:hypothetical protein
MMGLKNGKDGAWPKLLSVQAKLGEGSHFPDFPIINPPTTSDQGFSLFIPGLFFPINGQGVSLAFSLPVFFHAPLFVEFEEVEKWMRN